MKHKVTKTDVEGWYMYRTVRIARHDGNRGYWGHWSARAFGQRLASATRGDLLKQIDKGFEEAEAKSTARLDAANKAAGQ